MGTLNLVEFIPQETITEYTLSSIIARLFEDTRLYLDFTVFKVMNL